MDINTTLLRERFVIREISGGRNQPDGDTIVATSNRMSLPLGNEQEGSASGFVIRSRFMHGAVRMASRLVFLDTRHKLLADQNGQYDLSAVCEQMIPDHDLAYNGDPWVVVYKAGKIVFQSGNHHPFLDVIEKYDAKSPGNYDRSVVAAEKAFEQMGRKVSISHNSNIGLVAHLRHSMGRCGMIVRNPHKSTTFNYVAENTGEDQNLMPCDCLNACAAFLEGIQLSVRLGMINEQFRQGQIESASQEMKEAQSARSRLSDLVQEIGQFEDKYTVHYRPERADFSAIVKEAERFERQSIHSTTIGKSG